MIADPPKSEKRRILHYNYIFLLKYIQLYFCEAFAISLHCSIAIVKKKGTILSRTLYKNEIFHRQLKCTFHSYKWLCKLGSLALSKCPPFLGWNGLSKKKHIEHEELWYRVSQNVLICREYSLPSIYFHSKLRRHAVKTKSIVILVYLSTDGTTRTILLYS